MSVSSADTIPHASLACISGTGEMPQLIREFDWRQTPLGAPVQWPQVLQHTLALLLRSPFPMVLYWGPTLICLYNDAFRNTLGSQGKHPYILGRPGHEAWAEIWPEIGPMIESVYQNGNGSIFYDRLVPIIRNGRTEDVYWTFSHSPVVDLQGLTTGVLSVCTETTTRVNKLHNIVGLTSAPIMIFKGPDLIVEEANQATLDLWQVGREALGKPFLEIKPEFTAQPFVQLIQQVYYTGQPFKGYEYPSHFHRPDGRVDTYYFNFEYSPYREANGDISGVMILATDVTAQVLQKKELAVAEDEMRVAIGAANLGYFNYNPATRQFHCNQRLQELFGVEADTEAVLPALLQTLPPTDLDAVRQAVGNALAVGGTRRFESAFRVTHPKTGKLRYLRATGQAYFDTEKLPYRLSGTVQDITVEKDYETTLQQSEEKYRSLFENMDQGFCIIEVLFDQNGEGYDYRFLEYNQRFSEHSGLQDALGKTMRELVPEIEDEWPRRYGEVVLRGEPTSFVQQSDVLNRWFSVSAYRLGAADHKQVAILFSDITARKQNEQALSLSEERSRLALESGGMSAWLLHLPTHICTVDDFTYRMFQVDPATYNGDAQVFIDRVVAEHRDFVSAALAETAATGKPYKVEFRVQLPDGTEKWLFGYGTLERDAAGKPSIIRGLNQDITERKKAEIALREQQNFVESIIDASPSLTYIYDLKQDGNLYASPQVRSILGYTKEEVQQMGSTFLPGVMHPDDQAAAAAHLDKIVNSLHDEVHDLEYRMKHKDGHYVWLFDRSRVFRRNAAGEPLQVLGVATNITQRKELEQKTAKQFEELENIYRTAPIGLGLIDRDLRFIRINEKLAEINGMAASLHVGRTIGEVVPDMAAQAESLLRQVFETGQPLLHLELMGETPAQPGVLRTWMESWFPIKNENGQTEAVSMVVEEITERRKNENQLRESEERFRSLANDMPAFMFMADADTDISFLNRQWLEFIGQDYEQAKGKAWADITHPEDVPPMLAVYGHAVTTHQPYQYEIRQRAADGQYHYILWKGRPRVGADGEFKGMMGVGVDVTESRQAADALRKSEDLFRSFSNHIQNLAWIADGHGWIYWYNQRWYDFTGTNLETMEGWGWERVHHPNHIHRVLAFVQVAWEKGEPWELTFPLRRHDGVYRWFLTRAEPIRNEKGQVVRWIGTNTDIEDQVTAQQALQQSEEQLRQLADFMPQIVWAARPDGFHDFYNRRWYEFTGLSHEATNETAWRAVLHPEDFDPTWTLWQESLHNGALYETEYRMRRNDGQYRWLLARAMPIRNESGTIVRWLGTCTDIHDQKNMARQLEETVQQRTQELQRSNADLQQFAHVASHDLKEPVRKIRTFISYINQLYGNELPGKAALYLGKVDHAANRMIAMIEGVLLYASLDAVEQKDTRIDLNTLVQGILDDLEVVIQEKQARISFHNLLPVTGTPILVQQLLYNLIRNSLKFAQKGLPPTIRLETRPCQHPNDRMTKTASNAWVELTITDNGIGFGKEDVEFIFGSFTRLHSKDTFEGTGLGLSLCRKITDRHGGTIRASGELGKGAVFTVVLPGAR